MYEKSIKLQRTQSLLRELIPEALATLSDTRLNSIGIVDVSCSRGKYHAEVYLTAPFATPKEKGEILRQLRRAEGALRDYCLSATGWFKCPHFHFSFDDSNEEGNRLDVIFKQIQKEREGR